MPNANFLIKYVAFLKEDTGVSEEWIVSGSTTPLAVYLELAKKYHFIYSPELFKVAINDEFQCMDTILNDLDTVIFIPPVAGG